MHGTASPIHSLSLSLKPAQIFERGGLTELEAAQL
jgi:hypothetical protein